MTSAELVARFLMVNLHIALLLSIYLLLRPLLRRFLTPRTVYALSYPVFLLLLMPLLPIDIPSVADVFYELLIRLSSVSTATKAITVPALQTASSIPTSINELAISVSGGLTDTTAYILIAICLFGIVAAIIRRINSLRNLYELRSAAVSVSDTHIIEIYADCRRTLSIKHDIPIFSSADIPTPMLCGLIHPAICLPEQIVSGGSDRDLKYILLHELSHYRYADAFGNILSELTLVIYWFNPLVRLAARASRSDRELACDASVLSALSQNEYAIYGNILIAMAEHGADMASPSVSLGLSGTYRSLRRRIMAISSYKNPSLTRRVFGAFLIVAATALAFLAVPSFSVFAINNTVYDILPPPDSLCLIDASPYFGDYEGCFVGFDTASGVYTVYDLDNAVARRSPDSTYKVYDALLALDAGVISPNSSEMAWDGTTYPFDEWNKNQDLASAMSGSVNWYFEQLDKDLGYPRIKSGLKKMGYGNMAVSAFSDTYWLEGSLLVSPIEQAELMAKLADGSLPFDNENITAVRNAISLKSTDSITLYGKTGTGRVDDKNISGWFIGYVSRTEGNYCFVVWIGAKDNADGAAASEIALKILSDMGIL